MSPSAIAPRNPLPGLEHYASHSPLSGGFLQQPPTVDLTQSSEHFSSSSDVLPYVGLNLEEQ